MKVRKLLLVIVVGLIAGGAWWLSHRSTTNTIVSGTIETDEVHVASRYGGRVVKLHGTEGDTIRAGQVIAELDATELVARRDYAAAVLAELEHGPRPEEIANAKQTWDALTVDGQFARAEQKRAQQLFADKAISKSELENTTSKADSLDKRADAAKSAYDLLVAGTRPERVAQARAQLAEIESQVREMQVVAPSDCVLEVLSVKVGDVLPANREVATLLLTQHLWVRVYVPETWLGLIQIGQKVKVRTDSTPDKTVEGVVEQINRQAEFTPRNVQTVEDRVRQVFGVKVRLPADTNLLRAGMSADVLFPNVPPAPR